MKHIKYPSTRRFSDIVQAMKTMKSEKEIEFTFKPKVKLHGINIGMVREFGGLWHFQTRNEIVSKDNDSFEILGSVQLPTETIGGAEMIIFGEYCGQGLAKNPDVISSIPNRMFFVFGIAYALTGEFGSTHVTECDIRYEHDPKAILEVLKTVYEGQVPTNIKVLPYIDEATVTIKQFSPEHNKQEFERANRVVSEIGVCDPYVKETFGIDGRGEGLVYYQMDGVWEGKMPFFFKVKSEHHDVVKRNSVKHEIVIPDNVQALVDDFVTPQRVEQMAHENNLEVCLRNAGAIIKATVNDVIKEAVNEMEVGNITKKQVGSVAPSVIRRIILDIENKKALS